MDIISTQRDFSKFRAPSRRLITKTTIRVCLFSATAGGLAFYICMTWFVSMDLRKAGIPVHYPDLEPLGSLLGAGTACAALAKALLVAVRSIGYGELIYSAPKTGLTKLFIRRSNPVSSEYHFMMFELTVIQLGIGYGVV